MNHVAAPEAIQQAPRKQRAMRLASSLRQAIEQGVLEVGAWLPSVRELAEQYEVSRNTVLAALRRLEHEGLVIYQPRRGGVVKARPTNTDSGSVQTRRVGIITMRWQPVGRKPPASDPNKPKILDKHAWAGQIMIAAQTALLEAGFEPVLIPFVYSDPSTIDPETNASIQEWLETLAGVLLMPGEAVSSITRAFEQAGRPYLTINRPSMYTTHNFVSANHGQAGRMVGDHAARLGLTRVLLLTFSHSFGRSSLNIEHAGGILEGAAAYGGSTIQTRCLSLQGPEQPDWQDRIEQELRQSPPQLIFAEHDRQAVHALRACRSIGMAVPEQVRIIGGSGLASNDEIDLAALAAVNQPLSRVGGTAGAMLAHMIRSGETTMPGRLIPCTFESGSTCPLPDSRQAPSQADHDSTLNPIDQIGAIDDGANKTPLAVDDRHPFTPEHDQALVGAALARPE